MGGSESKANDLLIGMKHTINTEVSIINFNYNFETKMETFPNARHENI